MTRPHSHARRRASVLAVVITAGSLLLAGCGSSTPKATVDPNVDASKTTPPAAATMWPLTGVKADVVERPAITVKIENSTAARPQTGLEDADIVWEEVVEGGITRFAAMYNSKLPETVGPIRSVRPMDPDIAAATHGLMVFSGGQGQYVDMVAASGLQIISMDGGAAGFSRSGSRPAPHNVYGKMQTFLSQANASHKDLPQQIFSYAQTVDQSSASMSGKPATVLQLRFSGAEQPGWTWNGGKGVWQRNESGTAFMSASGGQISAVNVVIMRVEVKNTSAKDPAGNPVPETSVIGSGKAIVAANGKTISGSWSKEDQDSPVTFTSDDGSTITLAPGNTWVELVPATFGGADVKVG